MKKLDLNKITAVVFVITIFLSILAMMMKVGHFGFHMITSTILAGAAISTCILMVLVLVWLVSNLINYKK